MPENPPSPPPPAAPSGGETAESAPPPLPAASGGGQTFSQLLAAAGGGGRPSPIITVPVVAVPCYFTPAGFGESHGFTGQFAMTHQAVLATVTAQAQMQMQNTHSPSLELMTNTFSQPLQSPISPVPLQQLPSPLPEGAASDAYHWRKYGQKQVKSSDNSRSYYRCTDANCLAKKKVERRPDGTVLDVTYRGKHTHDPPKNYRYPRDKGHHNTGASGEHDSLPKGNDPSSCKDECNNTGNETLEQQLFCSSDCEVDAGTKNEEDVAEEPDSKRRVIESPKWSTTPAHKTVREYIVQTEIDARHLSDGYKWRKYGQKLVKGNPNPRSYYRCTHEGCPVRKHVERTSNDSKSVLITYEGKHNHDQPASKYLSDPSATPKGSIAMAANEKSDVSSSSLNNKLLEQPRPDNAIEAIVGEKASDLEGNTGVKTTLDVSSSSLNHKLLEPRPDNASETIVGEKISELEGNAGLETTLESAQAVLNIGLKSSADEDADRMSSDNVKTPLFNESKAAVPVQNS